MSSSTPPQTNDPQQQGQQQSQMQQGLTGSLSPRQVPMSAALGQLQQWQDRMSAIEQRYNQLTGQNYRYQSPSETAQLGGVPPLEQASQQGVSGLQQMASQLAERYGIGGRAPVVDQAGNFTRMPNSADEAVKFQYIAQALANYRAEQQQNKAVAAQQAGIGLVQNRARGSLATMQSGQYQSLAQTYQSDIDRITSMTPDFSYFIEKEMQERRENLVREMQSFQKKQSKYAMVGSILGMVGGFALGGLGGAAMGYQMGGTIGGGSAYF